MKIESRQLRIFIYSHKFLLIGLIVLLSYFEFSATLVENHSTVIPSQTDFKAVIPCPELVPSLEQILDQSENLSNQGILIETLDGGTQLAAMNIDHLYNPASGLKIPLSLAALERWGAEHRFRTSFYIDGEIDPDRKALNGNLILYSEGDPTLRVNALINLIRDLKQFDIRNVNGDLIINGPFSLNSLFSYEKSIQIARQKLSQNGIYIHGEVYSGAVNGELLVSYHSDPLIDILWYQNAFSVNAIAERLGELLGGPDGLTLYLVRYAGLELEDIFITHTSGLDYNRITPRGMIKILRKLYRWCEENHYAIDQIMPVAGIDGGTLHRRFKEIDYRGGILAKTGTLVETDLGVSALVGFINTQAYGVLVFGIFNSHGDVLTFQRWQNNFVKNIINRAGGIVPFREFPLEGRFVYDYQKSANKFNLSSESNTPISYFD
ncbi:D-alanyl-D-alanine carboxypeptidase [candidate division KSB1 bacterium]|nr:D-alanyl-D-alanine carboxypeptidase [candidate division KSB1 bacterium]